MGFPFFREMKKTRHWEQWFQGIFKQWKEAIIFLAEVFRAPTKFFYWRRDSTPDRGDCPRRKV
jgi:hypothetical protein